MGFLYCKSYCLLDNGNLFLAIEFRIVFYLNNRNFSIPCLTLHPNVSVSSDANNDDVTMNI